MGKVAWIGILRLDMPGVKEELIMGKERNKKEIKTKEELKICHSMMLTTTIGKQED